MRSAYMGDVTDYILDRISDPPHGAAPIQLAAMTALSAMTALNTALSADYIA